VLSVLAHPDDETYRCGGTLALMARKGVRVYLLTATQGQAGSCGDPPLCSPAELAAVRERELRCACDALGILPPTVLDFEDGRLAEIGTHSIIDAILSTVAIVDPQVLISFGPDGLSGHPDHVAIGRCAAEVFARSSGIAAIYTLAVPRSLAERLEMRQVHAVPDGQITLTVDVTSAWEAKRAAMGCHRTQRSSTPLMGAPESRQREFFGSEFFIRAGCRNPDDDFLPQVLKEYGR
jgi:LmbE family N-acetylglucosaminyl deacetylase